MKKKHFLGFLASLACLTCFAACGGEENAPDLNKAKDMLDGLYKSTAEVTGSDFERVGKLTIDKNDYTIVWTVELAEGVTEGVTVTKNEDGTYTIDVDEEAEADVAYVLKATITDKNGKTKVVTYNHKVPKFVEMTHEEFVAAEDKDAVVVKGVVTGIVNTKSKHELYFEDADGGYYAYNLAAEELEGVAIGNTVRVRGTRGTHSGVYQINDGAVEVLDASTTAPEATDITQAFKDAETLKDEDLLAYQSQYVKLTGAIVLGQDKSNDTYFNFMLGGKISYVRISGSACMFGESDQNAFEDSVKANVGKEATVTGLVSIYNGKAYIIPVTKDAYTYNTTATERTAAEKVELEKQILEILFDTYELTDDTKVQTKGIVYPDDVTISWASNNADLVTFDAKSSTLKVTLPKDAAKEITLTATISCEGTDSKTATFEEITVIKDPPLVPDAITAKPVAGQAYKFYLYQGGLKKNLYFAGDMDGYYLATTGNPELAADIYLKDAGEGKFYIYYGNADATKGIYINLYARNSGTEQAPNWNPSISTGRDATTKWNWNTEYNTFVSDPIATKEGTDPITAYLGTYGTYSTFSSSLVSYLGGSTNYAAQLATLINKETAEPQVKADKELKDLDLSGIYSTYSEAATVTLPNAAQYFEGVTIAYEITAGNTVASISGNTLTITPGATTVNATLKVTVTVGGKTATKNVNFTVDEPKVLLAVDTPAVNTEYVYYYYHTQNQKNYFFTGYAKEGDYYFSASENAADAVGLYLEEATGGYNVYYLVNTAKTYLVVYESGTHINAKTTTTKADASVFTYNSEYKTLLTTVGTKGNYFLGTFNTNTDCRPSAEKYLSQGNYVTHFGVYKKASEISANDKVAQEKLAFNPLIDATVAANKTITVPVAGVAFNDVTIVWSSNNTAVATVDGANITFTQGATEQQVTLSAQFYVGGAVVGDPITYQVTVAAMPQYYYEEITAAPEVGKAYKLHMYQGNVNKDVYFTGAFDGDYLATSENAADAADVYVELKDGSTTEYWMYIMEGTTKKYVYFYTETNGSAISMKMAIDATLQATALPFSWNTTIGTLATGPVSTTNKDGSQSYNNDFYAFGTKNTSTYTTLGARYDANNFFAVLATPIDKATATDATKVAKEKVQVERNVTFEAFAENTTATLPTAGYIFDDVTIAWASSNTTVAAVNGGTLTITQPTDADVNVTLTATIACGTTTNTATVTFKVAKVLSGDVSEETFAIAASAGSLAGDSLSISWASNNFNFVGQKGSGNAIRTSDSDHFRLYQGAIFTVSGKNSEGITKIVLKCTASDYCVAPTVSTSGVTASVEGTTITLTVTGTATEVTFTAAKQIRIKSITVTYNA